MNSLFFSYFQRIFFTLVGLFLFSQNAYNQALTIEECGRLARENFPLIKQLSLIEKTKEYSLENAQKGNLPQVNINGQASYQSDVTSLPIKLPNVSVPTISKDQYRLYADVFQSLTDFKTVNIQKEVVSANAATEKQKVEVELYKLTDRVNQVFYGILLMKAQLKQAELLKKDLQTGIEKIQAGIKNGISTKNNEDLLLAETLKIDQRMVELRATQQAYYQMLSLLINQPISNQTVFIEPSVLALSPTINRPEIKLFDLQQQTLDLQLKQLNTKYKPRVGLFLQTGYGRPALNMLNNNFDFYYIGGLRLNWNLSAFYTRKNDQQLMGINRSILDIQKETFLLNTNLTLAQQNEEATKYQQLLTADNELIKLRERIKQTATIQLENGIISPLDYITFLNAEDQAKQNQLLHQIQLLMAQYNYKTTSGN